MKSIKLTNPIKDKIVSMIMEAKQEKCVKMQNDMNTFFLDGFIENMMTKTDLEKFNSCDKSWFNPRRSFSIKYEGEYISFYTPERSIVLPYYLVHGVQGPFSKGDNKFIDECVKLQEELKLFTKELNKTRYQVRLTVSSFNTSKQLKEGWPEIANVVELLEKRSEDAAGHKQKLPMVVTKALNKELDLPIDLVSKAG